MKAIATSVTRNTGLATRETPILCLSQGDVQEEGQRGEYKTSNSIHWYPPCAGEPGERQCLQKHIVPPAGALGWRRRWSTDAIKWLRCACGLVRIGSGVC